MTLYSCRTVNRNIDFERLNRILLVHLPSLARQWFPEGKKSGNEWIARNVTRADRHIGSFSINTRTGRWSDFSTKDAGGDVISLAAYRFGTSQLDAARSLAIGLGLSEVF